MVLTPPIYILHRKKGLRPNLSRFYIKTTQMGMATSALYYPWNLLTDMEDITSGRNLGSHTESIAPDHEADDEGGASGDDLAKGPVWHGLCFSDVTARIRDNLDMPRYDYSARVVFAISVLSGSWKCYIIVTSPGKQL